MKVSWASCVESGLGGINPFIPLFSPQELLIRGPGTAPCATILGDSFLLPFSFSCIGTDCTPFPSVPSSDWNPLP